MTNRLLYTLFLFILMTSCPAQSLRIAFYNVENAFDTLRSPGKDDAEFTPQGEKRWDTRRYRTKIDHLAQVAADLSADWPTLPSGCAR